MLGTKNPDLQRIATADERHAWLEHHDVEVQDTLAHLISNARLREAVACLEWHVERTAEIRFLVGDPRLNIRWAEAVALLLADRNADGLAAVRLLMFAYPHHCGRMRRHHPHPWTLHELRYDCDGHSGLAEVA